jgi:hypothetical protein
LIVTGHCVLKDEVCRSGEMGVEDE